jgi:hypothetical protein
MGHAENLSLAGRHQEAIAQESEALDMLRSSANIDNRTISESLVHLGQYHRNVMAHATTLKYFKEATALRRTLSPPDDPDDAVGWEMDSGTVLHNTAVTLVDMKRFDEALQ